MATPTAEDLVYADVLRWTNWAIQNGQAGGSMGDTTNRAIQRMRLPEPGQDMYFRLLKSVTRLVVNGPMVVDKGPEPKPYKKRPDAPERVELLEVKDIRPTLVTPPPKRLN